MQPIPDDLTTLISDLEFFLSDGLKGENLSKKAKEKRDAFLKRIKEIRASYPQDFIEKRDAEDSDEVDDTDSFNDGGSLHSERADKDEESGLDGAQQSPPVAAQDLPSVFKAGYLEKRRKDHSFFGTEWQKRWCALSYRTFYYYGSDKGDGVQEASSLLFCIFTAAVFRFPLGSERSSSLNNKQQKGEFCIDGYAVKINKALRKDAKKDCCFEISAPDRRVYQFCAATQKDAEEWVEQIQFVLRDIGSGIIPEDDEEPQTYDDVGNTASQPNSAPAAPEPIDEDIYEELPDEEVPHPPKAKVEILSKPAPPAAPAPAAPVPPVNKSTDYKNYFQGKWDCTADHPDELSFKRGDAIYILSKEYENFGWWVGELKGSVGIVPRDYLMELYAI